MAKHENMLVAMKITADRNNRMYEAMKADVMRHETLSFELASKFETHFDVFNQVCENIEALKSHALLTDLHLEAFQPLQTAAIAFEVGKGLL